MIDVYFSHRKKFLHIASDIGYNVGTRCDNFDTNSIESAMEEGLDISFVDNNFKDPDIDQLLDVIYRTSPDVAVLPDIYDVDELGDVVRFGKRVESTGTVPIVVPKADIEMSKIPDNWIVGYSVQSEYGDTCIDITDICEHKVHLLGGSPKQQLSVANECIENGASIQSVDSNSFAKAAGFGNIVNDVPNLLGNGNFWDTDVDYPEDWSGRVIVSLVRYYMMWRDWSLMHGL